MQNLGSITDIDATSASGLYPERGTLYELLVCPTCGKRVLTEAAWHEDMEGPDDLAPSVVLPEQQDLHARAFYSAHELDIRCMVLAVDEARRSKSEDGSNRPMVGAVASQAGAIVASAHRGELKPGDHAEFTLLEGKCQNVELAGATVYTTLEPCTTRNHPKVPCAERLVARKVARVVIGMLDPDDRIRGLGVLALRKANIRVDLFPPDLMTKLEEMNRAFISDRESKKSETSTIGNLGEDAQGTAEVLAAKRSLVSLAKYFFAFIRKLPDGSTSSIQRADRLFREATLPDASELARLRNDAATVGPSFDDLAVTVVSGIEWMVRIVQMVQATSVGMGFDYSRVNWDEWAQRRSDTEKCLTALGKA